ncbi:unnamed protein product [Vitrella brassicaformis CCMP3155]|uniref:Uncharacterized protein n=3 Tax=Vitrella brassicaformis TaxID=1169539 RepID=A0A0G4FNH2_VITBC|nr:unnamed protein product [Vitrella brassicaformis CCMP3155]|eukprot:CEM15806.1 unnamed protein product [Vitrella brassicaformis CCMP3155]
MSHPRKPKQKPPTLYDGVWWGKLQDGLYMKAEEAVGKTFDNRKLLRVHDPRQCLLCQTGDEGCVLFALDEATGQMHPHSQCRMHPKCLVDSKKASGEWWQVCTHCSPPKAISYSNYSDHIQKHHPDLHVSVRKNRHETDRIEREEMYVEAAEHQLQQMGLARHPPNPRAMFGQPSPFPQPPNHFVAPPYPLPPPQYNHGQPARPPGPPATNDHWPMQMQMQVQPHPQAHPRGRLPSPPNGPPISFGGPPPPAMAPQPFSQVHHPPPLPIPYAQTNGTVTADDYMREQSVDVDRATTDEMNESLVDRMIGPLKTETPPRMSEERRVPSQQRQEPPESRQPPPAPPPPPSPSAATSSYPGLTQFAMRTLGASHPSFAPPPPPQPLQQPMAQMPPNCIPCEDAVAKANLILDSFKRTGWRGTGGGGGGGKPPVQRVVGALAGVGALDGMGAGARKGVELPIEDAEVNSLTDLFRKFSPCARFLAGPDAHHLSSSLSDTNVGGDGGASRRPYCRVSFDSDLEDGDVMLVRRDANRPDEVELQVVPGASTPLDNFAFSISIERRKEKVPLSIACRYADDFDSDAEDTAAAAVFDDQQQQQQQQDDAALWEEEYRHDANGVTDEELVDLETLVVRVSGDGEVRPLEPRIATIVFAHHKGKAHFNVSIQEMIINNRDGLFKPGNLKAKPPKDAWAFYQNATLQDDFANRELEMKECRVVVADQHSHWAFDKFNAHYLVAYTMPGYRLFLQPLSTTHLAAAANNNNTNTNTPASPLHAPTDAPVAPPAAAGAAAVGVGANFPSPPPGSSASSGSVGSFDRRGSTELALRVRGPLRKIELGRSIGAPRGPPVQDFGQGALRLDGFVTFKRGQTSQFRVQGGLCSLSFHGLGSPRQIRSTGKVMQKNM